MNDAAHDHWRVYLDGAPGDLDYLPKLRSNSWKVEQDDAGYYLRSDDFERFEDSATIWEKADDVRLRVEMAADLAFGHVGPLRPSRVTEMKRDGTRHNYVFLSATSRQYSRAFATLTVSGSKQGPTLAEIIDSVWHIEGVRKAVRLFRRTDGQWTATCRSIYEIIRGDVATEQALGKDQRGKALGPTGAGWVKDDEFQRFWTAIHDSSFSELDALHPLWDGKSHSNPMTQKEARAFTRSLLDRWLRWKYDQLYPQV